MFVESKGRGLVLAMALVLGSAMGHGLQAQAIGKVLGVEAGYAYIVSSSGLEPGLESGVIAGLRYGYLILDRGYTSAILSLVVGYQGFPEGASGKPLNAFVYGLEYEHLLFERGPVALGLEYGLLFDMLSEGGRDGVAFGNHTRLGLGPDFRLGERDDILVLADYNIVDMSYFDLASAKFGFPSIAIRYQWRFQPRGQS
jgi:hypothetical protein